ncbi:MAG TPA: pyridoxal-phosphate dependent enzyme, partial [Flavisolibacter sp.]|nr:pyridoxal-phosphate dependent enzyme [Flavisolibacter sp.]
REEYKNKSIPQLLKEQLNQDKYYFINEGGYGPLGVEGAKTILSEIQVNDYTHILAAVGTGTTLAGIISAALKGQSIIGISVLKNNLSVPSEIMDLLPPEKHMQFLINHDFHFGGYAKYTPGLTSFMNEWFLTTGIPSDFVYTGKLFYGANELIRANYFPNGSKLLIIHSGGLQGNRSLSNGTLIF